MKIRPWVLVVVSTLCFSCFAFAEKSGAGLSTITKEYHKLSIMLQECSLLYPKQAASYRKYFSSWLIRNRLPLKKGETESKKLSARRGVKLKQSIKEYQLYEKQQFKDPELIKKNKTCAYLPSYMAE